MLHAMNPLLISSIYPTVNSSAQATGNQFNLATLNALMSVNQQKSLAPVDSVTQQYLLAHYQHQAQQQHHHQLMQSISAISNAMSNPVNLLKRSSDSLHASHLLPSANSTLSNSANTAFTPVAKKQAIAVSKLGPNPSPQQQPSNNNSSIASVSTASVSSQEDSTRHSTTTMAPLNTVQAVIPTLMNPMMAAPPLMFTSSAAPTGSAALSSLHYSNPIRFKEKEYKIVGRTRVFDHYESSPYKIYRVQIPEKYRTNHGNESNALFDAGVSIPFSPPDSSERHIEFRLRIMGNARTINDLFVVATDLCRILNIRKSNTAKTVAKFDEEEKAAMPSYCYSANGNGTMRILTVLTLAGVNKLTHQSHCPLAPPLAAWIHKEFIRLVQAHNHKLINGFNGFMMGSVNMNYANQVIIQEQQNESNELYIRVRPSKNQPAEAVNTQISNTITSNDNNNNKNNTMSHAANLSSVSLLERLNPNSNPSSAVKQEVSSKDYDRSSALADAASTSTSLLSLSAQLSCSPIVHKEILEVVPVMNGRVVETV
jgi:prophage antirepressor-like protein